MQTQWKLDLFSHNGGHAEAFYSNTGDLSTAKALFNHVTYFGDVDSGGGIEIIPSLPSGQYIKCAVADLVINWSTTFMRPNVVITSGATGVEVDVTLGNGFTLYSFNGGASLGIFCPGGTKNGVTISGSVKSILK